MGSMLLPTGDFASPRPSTAPQKSAPLAQATSSISNRWFVPEPRRAHGTGTTTLPKGKDDPAGQSLVRPGFQVPTEAQESCVTLGPWFGPSRPPRASCNSASLLYIGATRIHAQTFARDWQWFPSKYFTPGLCLSPSALGLPGTDSKATTAPVGAGTETPTQPQTCPNTKCTPIRHQLLKRLRHVTEGVRVANTSLLPISWSEAEVRLPQCGGALDAGALQVLPAKFCTEDQALNIRAIQVQDRHCTWLYWIYFISSLGPFPAVRTRYTKVTRPPSQ